MPISTMRRELTAQEVAARFELNPKTIIAMGDAGILEMIDRSAVPPKRRKRRNPRFFLDDVEGYERLGGTVESRRRLMAS